VQKVMNTLLNELEVCRLFTTISLWTHTVRSHKLATHSNEVNNMGPHTWIEVELMHLVMFSSFENGSVHRRYRLMSKAFFSFPGLLHMFCTQVVHNVSLYNLYTRVCCHLNVKPCTQVVHNVSLYKIYMSSSHPNIE